MTGESQSRADLSEEHEREIRLESIFMPHARRLRHAHYQRHMQANGSMRFVHYTSAEAALAIIKSKRLWMRNTTCMSDYREVQHGFEILSSYFRDDTNRTAFTEALDSCAPGAALQAIAIFDQWWNDIRLSTYITSVSEHDDKEDLHGRLSMWRAFGSNATRVALVLRVPYFTEATVALNLTFSPVAYLTEVEVHGVLSEVIRNIRGNSDFLGSLGHTNVVWMAFNTLVSGVTCLKHEGFHEEREWRAIYAPKRSSSPLMESSTETVGGVPQIVYKLPLDASVSDALQSLDLARIFDRLIIGPSPYPSVMSDAFVAALENSGVADAGTRVFASNIPIRA